MRIKTLEQLEEERDKAQRAMDRAQWERDKEEEKEYLFGDGHSGHTGEEEDGEIRLETTGINDIYIDKFGRTIIGGEVQSDPGGSDPWDEPNEHAGESPAERQIRLGEEDEGDNPTIVVEQEEPLPQAQSTPCPSCGVCSDLRSRYTDVRGVAFDREGVAHLGWVCRCGEERHIDGRELPPDLCERGDDAADFLRDVASYCEKPPRD